MAVYRYTVTLQDERDGLFTRTYEGDFADQAAADTAASALLTDIQALTTAGVVETVGPGLVTTGVSTAAAGSRVTDRISATMELVTANKKANLTFPSPAAAVLSGNNLVFNQSPANAWDDYVANYQTGNWYISDGEHVAAADPTVKGKLITVRSGQRTLPT